MARCAQHTFYLEGVKVSSGMCTYRDPLTGQDFKVVAGKARHPSEISVRELPDGAELRLVGLQHRLARSSVSSALHTALPTLTFQPRQAYGRAGRRALDLDALRERCGTPAGFAALLHTVTAGLHQLRPGDPYAAALAAAWVTHLDALPSLHLTVRERLTVCAPHLDDAGRLQLLSRLREHTNATDRLGWHADRCLAVLDTIDALARTGDPAVLAPQLLAALREVLSPEPGEVYGNWAVLVQAAVGITTQEFFTSWTHTPTSSTPLIPLGQNPGHDLPPTVYLRAFHVAAALAPHLTGTPQHVQLLELFEQLTASAIPEQLEWARLNLGPGAAGTLALPPPGRGCTPARWDRLFANLVAHDPRLAAARRELSPDQELLGHDGRPVTGFAAALARNAHEEYRFLLAASLPGLLAPLTLEHRARVWERLVADPALDLLVTSSLAGLAPILTAEQREVAARTVLQRVGTPRPGEPDAVRPAVIEMPVLLGALPDPDRLAAAATILAVAAPTEPTMCCLALHRARGTLTPERVAELVRSELLPAVDAAADRGLGLGTLHDLLLQSDHPLVEDRALTLELLESVFSRLHPGPGHRLPLEGSERYMGGELAHAPEFLTPSDLAPFVSRLLDDPRFLSAAYDPDRPHSSNTQAVMGTLTAVVRAAPALDDLADRLEDLHATTSPGGRVLLAQALPVLTGHLEPERAAGLVAALLEDGDREVRREAARLAPELFSAIYLREAGLSPTAENVWHPVVEPI